MIEDTCGFNTKNTSFFEPQVAMFTKYFKIVPTNLLMNMHYYKYQ